jgi:hypothetical protein
MLTLVHEVHIVCFPHEHASTGDDKANEDTIVQNKFDIHHLLILGGYHNDLAGKCVKAGGPTLALQLRRQCRSGEYSSRNQEPKWL